MPLDDEAVEKLLAGQGLADLEDLADLATALDDVRSLADGPVPAPSAALATILTMGAEERSRPTETEAPALALTLSTRKSTPGRGTLVKVSLAAAAIVAVAATLDVLPRPAQRLVATAVSAVTPFQLPDDTQDQSPEKKTRVAARRPPGPVEAAPRGVRPEVPPTVPPRQTDPGATGIAPPPAGTAGLNGIPERLRPKTPSASSPGAQPPLRGSSPVTSVPVTAVPVTSVPVVANPVAPAPPPAAPVSSVDRRSATLTGAVVQPGPGDPDGMGGASIELNGGTGQLCLTLTLSAVGPPTDVHLHQAPHGQTGPMVLAVPSPAEAAPPGPVCVLIASDLSKKLREDPTGYYLQVHTREFPDGALRGQLST
ncbi:MAG: CHRD domain-containing protein [Actinomycetota bacterium]|nr:CHRD domain-containing protein [Actinomycetota bacterium]